METEVMNAVNGISKETEYEFIFKKRVKASSIDDAIQKTNSKKFFLGTRIISVICKKGNPIEINCELGGKNV